MQGWKSPASAYNFNLKGNNMNAAELFQNALCSTKPLNETEVLVQIRTEDGEENIFYPIQDVEMCWKQVNGIFQDVLVVSLDQNITL